MKKNRETTRSAMLLKRYAAIADSISTLFFPYAEVVIHDTADRKVIHISNNLSRREVGDDSSIDELDINAKKKIYGPYEKLNWDGRRMRSISVTIDGEDGKPAGVMCVNFNIAVFEDIGAALELFVKGVGVASRPVDLFKDDWQERINIFLHEWLQKRQLALNTLTRDHKRELVEALYAEGAFNGKSAANYVATILGMGRATVYKHLKGMRDDAEPAE
ncbi:helix-turn-helix transcriptional regulator [Cupriavidus sp. 8B]